MSASHSYDGEARDYSWTDIKDAWDERDFDSAKTESDTDDEDNTGQTVGGTTDDDLGTVSTTFLPSSVDADELTDTQINILEAAAMRPTSSRYEIAAVVNASPQYISNVCTQHLPDHPAAAPPTETEETTAQTTLDAFGGER